MMWLNYALTFGFCVVPPQWASPTITNLTTSSALYIPLRTHRRIIRVINGESDQPERFAPRPRGVLKIIAGKSNKESTVERIWGAFHTQDNSLEDFL